MDEILLVAMIVVPAEILLAIVLIILLKQLYFNRRARELDSLNASFDRHFSKLADNALHINSKDFLRLAEHKLEKHGSVPVSNFETRKPNIQFPVDPLSDLLRRHVQHLQSVEKSRSGAYPSMEQKPKQEHQQTIGLEI